MKKLRINYRGWGESWHLGTLAHDGTDLLFEYSAHALSEGLELSPQHLRLQVEAHGHFPPHLDRLPGLVADCLPDGWGLLLMDRFFRSNGRNQATCSPLDRLAFLGDRTMGALTFQPADLLELPPPELKLLELARDIRRFIAGDDRQVLKELIALGGSPHGAHPKALVYYDPTTQSMSTHPAPGHRSLLVKFQAKGEHQEVCALEDLYCRLAGVCGLDVPQTYYFALDRSLSAFGIERFDRQSDLRVPVHTLAGALHLDFRLPSIDYGTFLRAIRVFTLDESEVQKGYERAIFNVLFNNRDDHPKNFSFALSRDRTWRLAPCYDLTFSAGPGGGHHMDVCGEGWNITREHMMRLAAEAQVKEKFATTALDRILGCSHLFEQLAKDRPIRRATVKSIAAAIASNRALL